MTPSGWHDDAASRDAGHDEMQAAVWRWLKRQPHPDHTIRHPPTVRDRFKIEQDEWAGDHIELPFLEGTKIVCFADVCRSYRVFEWWHNEEGAVAEFKRNVAMRHHILEVKPKIYSVGAVIRQIRALEQAIDGIRRQPSINAPIVHVVAVVPWNDPKADLLEEFGATVLRWDGDAPRKFEKDMAA